LLAAAAAAAAVAAVVEASRRRRPGPATARRRCVASTSTAALSYLSFTINCAGKQKQPASVNQSPEVISPYNYWDALVYSFEP